MTKKRKVILAILSIILILILIVCVKAYLFFNAKPNIKINYVAEWNKLSKPANYDPCENAYFDYQKASQFTQDIPEIINYGMKNGNWLNEPGDMNDGQLKILKDWLTANRKALVYFVIGSTKPYIWIEQKADSVSKERLYA